MSNSGQRRIPVGSQAFWLVLLLLLVVILGITMWKDWWLTGQEPNPLFYLLVPPISMLAGSVITCGVVRLSKQPVGFLEIVAVAVAVNIVMQFAEIVLKLVYYWLWEYPGLLYLAIAIPLGLVLMFCGFAFWTRAWWSLAAVMTAIYFVGELIAGILLSGIPGLSTPGS